MSGELKLYCKTHWIIASKSVDSVLNLKSVLQEIVTNYHNLLTNDKIKPIIQSRNFFSNLRILSFVLNSLKKAVLTLESKLATLADCFLCLTKLAAVLKNLLRSFNSEFCNYCAKVINKR